MFEPGRQTTRATRISVLKPRSANVVILLVDYKFQALQFLRKPNCSDNPGNTCADTYHPNWSYLINRSVLNYGSRCSDGHALWEGHGDTSLLVSTKEEEVELCCRLICGHAGMI